MPAICARICGAFAIIGASLFPPAAHAAVQRPFPLVTVTGEGVVMVVPDVAVASAGVTTEAKTPREAAEANNRAMSTVVDAIRKAGIPEADIRTARFSLFPVHAQRPRDGTPQITGYRATNQVQVKVRDVAKVAELLEQLIAAGATNILGVEFSVSQAGERLDQARAAAFADAKRKAELYARAAGSQVGRAVTITEREASMPRPMLYRGAPAAGAPAQPPIAPGEETLRAEVTVTFELLQ